MTTPQARIARPGIVLALALALALVASRVPAATGTATGTVPPNHPTAPPASNTPAPLPKIAPLPPTPATSADLSKARKVRQLTLVVRHRVFHDFVENIQAKLGEPFEIGDTDFEATVDRYVPDFTMDIYTGRVVSRTDQANNPAFRITVRQKGAPQDTTWALLDSPPHFTRKSMLAFQAVKIDFTSGKPMQSKLATAPGEKAK